MASVNRASAIVALLLLPVGEAARKSSSGVLPNLPVQPPPLAPVPPVPPVVVQQQRVEPLISQPRPESPLDAGVKAFVERPSFSLDELEAQEGGCDSSCGGVCFGTWNIQKLGQSKAKRPAVMVAIRSVLSRYDVALVQELSQLPKPPYECGPNTESVICAARPDESQYSVTASPRLGDEQYAVLVRGNSATASVGASYPDPEGLHLRPPHAFDISIQKGGEAWRLVAADTHTSPKKASTEIADFPKVLQWMRDQFSDSNNPAHFILAGDFNADGKYFREEKEWPGSHLGEGFAGYDLLTGNKLDSTVAVSSNSYDRIIADHGLAARAGRAGVFRLEGIDLTDVRAEGCRMGYVPSNLCDASLDELPWSEVPKDVKTELAKELSDHHPVEICLARP